jgi:hypothetical protein
MKYFCLLLVTLVCGTVHAATARIYLFARNIDRTIRDTDTVLRKRSVSVGVNYGSDVQFFGRTGPFKYPFASTDAIYNSKSGVFVYGSAIKVLGYDPLVAEVDLGGGYFYKYSKKFAGTISYTRFLFNDDAALVIRSASTNDINFKNSFDWKFAKSSVVFDYLFGQANDYFITLNTSKNIEPDWGVFDDKDYLSFNPTISAIIGTQNFVGNFSEDHQYRLEVANIFVPDEGKPVRYNNGRFNALNYSVKLPIAYNRPHYTFEASWKYSIPVNVENELKNRHEVFFNLTFFYLFF